MDETGSGKDKRKQGGMIVSTIARINNRNWLWYRAPLDHVLLVECKAMVWHLFEDMPGPWGGREYIGNFPRKRDMLEHIDSLEKGE